MLEKVSLLVGDTKIDHFIAHVHAYVICMRSAMISIGGVGHGMSYACLELDEVVNNGMNFHQYVIDHPTTLTTAKGIQKHTLTN